jgi:stage II sporulation protein D
VQDGELVSIVITDRETAVAAVVYAESVSCAPIEALKAQAIAARSYYLASSARHGDFQFCDTTHCQFLREHPEEIAAAGMAVSDTKVLVLFHGGVPLAALFSASCGEDANSCGGGYVSRRISPLRGCQTSATKRQRSLPGDFFTQLEDRTEAHRIKLRRVLGWNVLPGYNYQVRREGDHIVVDGRGEGHGIGLCQHGANIMATLGADYRRILNYYYPNTLIGLRK